MNCTAMRSRSAGRSVIRTPAPSSSSKTSTRGQFYFIEVNPRIQVEHTVTENITGIDLVKAQILIAGGATIGQADSGVPVQEEIRAYGHAMQCRITTEDPENNFIPDYGVVSAYRSPAGFGIRLDAGTAYAGRAHHALLRLDAGEGHRVGPHARRDRHAHAPRAQRIPHPRRARRICRSCSSCCSIRNFSRRNTRRRSSTTPPNCCVFPERTDQVSRLLNFVGDVIVNGNPEVRGRAVPAERVIPKAPEVRRDASAARHETTVG